MVEFVVKFPSVAHQFSETELDCEKITALKEQILIRTRAWNIFIESRIGVVKIKLK
jgi:hypothetical protein